MQLKYTKNPSDYIQEITRLTNEKYKNLHASDKQTREVIQTFQANLKDVIIKLTNKKPLITYKDKLTNQLIEAHISLRTGPSKKHTYSHVGWLNLLIIINTIPPDWTPNENKLTLYHRKPLTRKSHTKRIPQVIPTSPVR